MSSIMVWVIDAYYRKSATDISATLNTRQTESDFIRDKIKRLCQGCLELDPERRLLGLLMSSASTTQTPWILAIHIVR